MVKIVTNMELVTFLRAELLLTSVMLGCDFRDQHVDAMSPHLDMV